jgi:hypothetical protein
MHGLGVIITAWNTLTTTVELSAIPQDALVGHFADVA